jgi:hypothetical protein
VAFSLILTWPVAFVRGTAFAIPEYIIALLLSLLRAHTTAGLQELSKPAAKNLSGVLPE